MPRASKIENGYRNLLERSVGDQLTSARVPFDYEGARVSFVVPERKAHYLPDFRVGNIIIETKGWFGRGAKERQKLILVRNSNPELDIRLVFSDANKKIYKTSPTTYANWADHNNFKWATKIVPSSWIKDLLKESKHGNSVNR
jgi:hypothetical protein